MVISRNFTLEEFSVSDSYPQFANPVPFELRGNVFDLVHNVLQPICDATGWNCRITSGYRSAMLNRLVRGSKTSQHMRGKASDNQFYFRDKNSEVVWLSSYEVGAKVRDLGLDFDQMILYPTFVHLSYDKGRNRCQILYDRSYRGKRG